jgi:hypothetical protein
VSCSVTKDLLIPVVAVACPSCGIIAPECPHASAEECIRALEAEIRWLKGLLTRAREPSAQGRRS